MNYVVKKENSLNDSFWSKFDILVSENIKYAVQLNSIWLSNYIKYYLKKNQSPYVISVYEGNTLVGCLPLQVTKIRGTRFYDLRQLRILGFGPTDFFDIPVQKRDRKEIINVIINFLFKDKSWDLLELSELPNGSNSLKVLKECLLEKNIEAKIDIHNGFYFIETNDICWDEYEKKVFNPNNKDLLKSLRRIEKEKFSLQFYTIKKDVYKNLMNCIQLYSQRRETLGQFNNYETENLNEFLRNVICAYELKGNVELSILECEKVVWAFQLDWISDGVRYHWNHAYNEEYKRYSPGKLILKELLKQGFEENDIVSCNHMRGLSGYKTKFTNEKEMLVRIKMENPKSIKLKLTKLISRIIKVLKN